MSEYSLTVYPTLEEKPHVTEDEARAIWSSGKQPHIRMLFKLLWFTGLRIGEALQLTPKDIERRDFDFTLLVHTEKLPKDKKYHKVNAPTIDRLPLPRQFGLELMEYCLNENLRSGDLLFPRHRSTYFRQTRICARNAGIERWRELHPHMFRHGFVYDRAKAGVHPYILTKLARHRNLRTTMEYFHPDEGDLRMAMEK